MPLIDLKVHENGAMKRILGCKKEEVTEDQELHNLYSPPNITNQIKENEMHMEGMTKCIQKVGRKT